MTTGHWLPLGLDRDDTTVMFDEPVFLDFLHRPGEREVTHSEKGLEPLASGAACYPSARWCPASVAVKLRP